jgi:hypothetical protein
MLSRHFLGAFDIFFTAVSFAFKWQKLVVNQILALEHLVKVIGIINSNKHESSNDLVTC